MIMEQMGMLVDAQACADSDGYVGYCIDFQNAIHELGASCDIWCILKTNVAASYADGDETYEFQLRGGTGTDGTDINAGAVVIDTTGALNGDDARYDTAGDFIWRRTLDFYAGTFRYLQLYYAQTGTTNTITVDFSITPTAPRSEYNVQVAVSNVGTP